MNIELNIDGGTINEAVAKAVIESAIGEEIKRQIQAKLSDYKFSAAIAAVVDKTVGQCVYQVLMQDDYKARVMDATRKHVAEMAIEPLIDAAFNRLMESVDKMS